MRTNDAKGPRLVSYMLGYGHEVWSAGNYYFWVPMVAPFFGCTFGGFLYDTFIFTGSYASRFVFLCSVYVLSFPRNHLECG